LDTGNATSDDHHGSYFVGHNTPFNSENAK